LEELLANVKSHLGITEDDEDINKNIKLKTMATIGYLVDGGAIIDIDKVNEISDKERKIFAHKQSVGQKEFYQAQATGFKPELVFKVREFEYKGEQKLKYGNEIYNIIRTYVKEIGFVEIVCSRGVNNNVNS